MHKTENKAGGYSKQLKKLNFEYPRPYIEKNDNCTDAELDAYFKRREYYFENR